MPLISSISAEKISNSRGKETVELTVHLDDGETVGIASVPEGASKGEREAVAVPADQALKNLESIQAKFIGLDPTDQKGCDKLLIQLGGENKKDLGSNTTLAISLAVARAGASAKKIPLWKHIEEISASTAKLPRLVANLIEGGVHAHNDLPIQEYLVIPKTNDTHKAKGAIEDVYSRLGEILVKKYGNDATPIGDEGGFAAPITNMELPISMLMEAIEQSGHKDGIELGIDAAADQISISEAELINFYKKLSTDYPFTYLEDPFSEKHPELFAKILEIVSPKTLVVGDDLTVTNEDLIKVNATRGAISAVIIKPNQTGTLMEAIRAIQVARDNNLKTIVSHRGGETNDSFIADLAAGTGTDFFKLGAPSKPERLAKYNRLLEIQQELSN
ncbi:MAG: phosphopyruvate hydratase [Candidatus Harrisonbacteria bacterium CG10_big_fil_rev_8_21_14_0_10_44_23]|uniref:Enolase n=1 Tax=Candidatus Harrisonbacteria bacterium CG10_big_fil_rev_8_21_14_0_10_44_23 TaxID=1974585 RepID=A0A2H0UQK4_9BACT|nr:MAG: phosphopyruvate hydratase [Candidatus Harrisonbacteria bacterium CG10_big_fil_rev_8_21_14_0_10_44_23]